MLVRIYNLSYIPHYAIKATAELDNATDAFEVLRAGACEKVFDCWFESGSMPYGSKHYPFEGKEDLRASSFEHVFGQSVIFNPSPTFLLRQKKTQDRTPKFCFSCWK